MAVPKANLCSPKSDSDGESKPVRTESWKTVRENISSHHLPYSPSASPRSIISSQQQVPDGLTSVPLKPLTAGKLNSLANKAGTFSPELAFVSSTCGQTTFFTRARPTGKISLLSIDGGGVRGLMPATWCVRLETMLQEKTNNPDARLADFFDMFAGTSAGGVLALMLTLPGKNGRPAFTAGQVLEFWAGNAKNIFRRRLPRWMADIRNIWRPKYTVRDFEYLLDRFLGEHCGNPTPFLSSTLRPLVVTSYDAARSRPYFFLTERARASPSHDFLARDVCRATSAAPTLFRPALVTSCDGSRTMACIDGAVISNNPTMAAMLHMIQDQATFPPPTRQGVNRRSISDMLILSLGAGESITPLKYNDMRRKGLLGWAGPILDILVWGTGALQHSLFCVMADGEAASHNYLRIEVSDMPKVSTQLDNASPKNMARLAHLAESALEQRMPVVRTLAGEDHPDSRTLQERLEIFADALVEEYRERLLEQCPPQAPVVPSPATSVLPL